MDKLHHRPPKKVKGPRDVYFKMVLKLGTEFIAIFSCS